MASDLSQRQRNQYNPLNLGRFSQTSLRLLTSTLGMRSQIISGGYGNNTYNNWYQVTLDVPGWIILIKAGTTLSTSNASRSDLNYGNNSYFDVGVYDQNRNPIDGRIIHQHPQAYWGHVAGAQSDLYNTYNPDRFDKGNEMFYELEPGNYLICVSATRNEEFKYALGMVVEITDLDEQFILTEDALISYVLQENTLQTSGGNPIVEIPSEIRADITLDTTSAFTVTYADIGSGYFVQVNNQNPQTSGDLTWIIGPDLGIEPSDDSEDRILLDATEGWTDTIHSHSLSEWKTAWEREHSMDDRFPSGVFAPYTDAQ